MASRLAKCVHCRRPVLKALAIGNRRVHLDPEPVADGQWVITGGPPHDRPFYDARAADIRGTDPYVETALRRGEARYQEHNRTCRYAAETERPRLVVR